MELGDKKKNIKAIDKLTVHQICSGQVVVTLANAVKELIENSIDAGATNIEIKLKEYGSESIEVCDNGKGVKECDFQSLTLKHHTSKLEDFSDLLNVNTFGFRGEALSSLCALSKMTVVTCHELAAVGTSLEYDFNGQIVKQTPIARQIGTTVVLEKLFSTLPVRQGEFKRNIRKEYGKMLNLLTAYCLVSTGKRFICTNQTANGKRTSVLSTNGESNIKSLIACVFGSKQVSHLIDFEQKIPSATDLEAFSQEVTSDVDNVYMIEGYLSSTIHRTGRSTSDRQFFYINGRPCDLPKVARVINDIYHEFNRHQYPFVFLNIKLNEGSIDVNVTPDKRKILVPKEKLLLSIVKASVSAIYQHQPLTIKHFVAEQQKTQSLLSSAFSMIPLTPSSSASVKRSHEMCNLGKLTSPDLKYPKLAKGIDSEMTPIQEEKMNLSCVERDTENLVVVQLDGVSKISEPFLFGTNRTFVCEKAPSEKQDPPKHSNLHASTQIRFSQTLRFKEEKFIDKVKIKNFDSPKCLLLKNISQFVRNPSKHAAQSMSFTHEDSRSKSTNSSNLSERKMYVDSIIEQYESQLGEDCSVGTNITERSIPESVASPSYQNFEACVQVESEVITDEVLSQRRKAVPLEISLERLKEIIAKKSNLQNTVESTPYRKFRSAMTAEQAEDELRKEIRKEMFKDMEIIGQFNLGFIITKLQEDLFIIDQHATDEIYNFETLQKNTVLDSQKLLNLLNLDLTVPSETTLLDNIDIFEKNGFKFDILEEALPGKKVRLVSAPVSRNWSFGKEDIDELIFMLTDNSGCMCRPSRVNQMFASRACRKSVMIGTALSHSAMRKLVIHMGEINQPWVYLPWVLFVMSQQTRLVER